MLQQCPSMYNKVYWCLWTTLGSAFLRRDRWKRVWRGSVRGNCSLSSILVIAQRKVRFSDLWHQDLRRRSFRRLPTSNTYFPNSIHNYLLRRFATAEMAAMFNHFSPSITTTAELPKSSRFPAKRSLCSSAFWLFTLLPTSRRSLNYTESLCVLHSWLFNLCVSNKICWVKICVFGLIRIFASITFDDEIEIFDRPRVLILTRF